MVYQFSIYNNFFCSIERIGVFERITVYFFMLIFNIFGSNRSEDLRVLSTGA